ncbi:pyridoxamine 5'-phosphate oxidase family protein [Chloroflexota bacterium]
MAKLPAEVKEMFKQQLPLIATSSKDGVPNVGPKGSMYVVDDETLGYSEGTSRTTLDNIKENKKVAVMIIDKETMDGYQIKGTAELQTSGAIYDTMAERNKARNRPPAEYVVKISVEAVYTQKPGAPAHKIA